MSGDLVSAWRELSSRQSRVSCALERALQERHGLGRSEFEVLDRLGERFKPRMQELAEEMYLSQSALSRVVARLERDGLVERLLCAEDRRGIYVDLTDAGRARLEAARPTQHEVLEAHLSPARTPG